MYTMSSDFIKKIQFINESFSAIKYKKLIGWKIKENIVVK
jgi:hypothetical protein